MNKPIDISDRIRTVLVSDAATSAQTQDVLAEATNALEALGPAVEAVRARALDPTAVLDVADASRKELLDIEFRRDRLQAQIRALGSRVGDLRKAEQAQARTVRYNEVMARRDELAADLADAPQLISKLVALIRRVDAVEFEIESVNRQLDGRPYLVSAEAVARKVTPHFMRGASNMPRLADAKLPQWFADGPLWAWPPEDRYR